MKKKVFNTDMDAIESIFNSLIEKLANRIYTYGYKKILILCIGTPKEIGDSFGPIIGSMLKKYNLPDIVKVYGSTLEPLDGVSLPDFYEEKDEEISESLIIGIDSTVSSFHKIGNIIIGDDGFIPGAGTNVNNLFRKIGNLRICLVTSNDNLEITEITKEEVELKSNIVVNALVQSLVYINNEIDSINSIDEFSNLKIKYIQEELRNLKNQNDKLESYMSYYKRDLDDIKEKILYYSNEVKQGEE